MSKPRHESSLSKNTSIDLNQREELANKRWQSYADQDPYAINIQEFISDLSETLRLINDLVCQNNISTALLLGEKYYCICRKVRYANHPLTLEVKIVVPLVIYSLLFSLVYYSASDPSVANEILEQSLFLQIHVNKLLIQSMMTEDKTNSLLIELLSVFSHCLNYLETQKPNKVPSDVREIAEKFLSTLKNHNQFAGLRVNFAAQPDSNSHEAPPVSMNWHPDFFSALSRITAERRDKPQQVKQDHLLFLHYARLTELYLEIFEKDLVSLYAQIAKLHTLKVYSDSSSTKEFLPQLILVESAYILDIDFSQEPQTEVYGANVRLDRYVKMHAADNTIKNMSPHTIPVLHIAKCALANLAIGFHNNLQAALGFNDVADQLYTNMLAVAGNFKKKLLVMQSLSFAIAKDLLAFQLQKEGDGVTASFQRVLAMEPAASGSDLREKYKLTSTYFQFYLHFCQQIITSINLPLATTHLWLNKFVARASVFENEFISILTSVLTEQSNVIQIAANEIANFIDIHAVLIEFYEKNNFEEELPNQYQFIVQYVSIIGKLIINPESFYELAEDKGEKIVVLCTTLANKFAARDLLDGVEALLKNAVIIANYLRARNFISAMELQNEVCTAHYNFFPYYSSKFPDKAVALIEQGDECFNSLPDEYKKRKKKDSVFLQLLLTRYYMVGLYYTTKNNLAAAINYYEKSSRYLFLLDGLNSDFSANAGAVENIESARRSIQTFAAAHDDIFSCHIMRHNISKQYHAEVSIPPNLQLTATEPSPTEVDINPKLKKLFQAIETKDIKVIAELSKDEIAHTKHPVMGAPAICYAALLGYIFAFNSLLKTFKHIEDEQCNVLSWACSCQDVAARQLILQTLFDNVDHIPGLQAADVAAALGDSNYFAVQQEIAMSAVHYGLLTGKRDFYDAKKVAKSIISDRNITAPDLKTQTNLFIQQFRNTFVMSMDADPESRKQLLFALLLAMENIKKAYKTKQSVIPLYLRKYFIDIYYFLITQSHQRNQIAEAQKYFEHIVIEIQELQHQLALNDYMASWLLNIQSCLCFGARFYAQQDNLHQCLNFHRMALTYTKATLTRYSSGSRFNRKIADNFNQFLDLHELIWHTFLPKCIYPVFNGFFEILNDASKLFDFDNSEYLEKLGYRIVLIEYRTAEYHISHDKKNNTTSRLDTVLSCIDNAKIIEQKLLQQISRVDTADNTTVNWLYWMLVFHYHCYGYLKRLNHAMADHEFTQLTTFLTLIAKLTGEVELNSEQLLTVSETIRNVLAILIVEEPTQQHLSLAEKLIPKMAALQQKADEKASPEVREARSQIYKSLRLLTINYCKAHCMPEKDDNKVKQQFRDECVNAIFPLCNKMNTAESATLSEHELVIICDRLVRYTKIFPTGSSIHQIYKYLTQFLNLLTEEGKHYEGKHHKHDRSWLMTIPRLNYQIFQYLKMNFSDKTALIKSHLSIAIEFSYKELMMHDVQDVDECWTLLGQIVEYVELLDSEKERTIYITQHEQSNVLIERLTTQRGIEKISIVFLRYQYLNNLMLFIYCDGMKLDYYIKSQVTELILLSRMLEFTTYELNDVKYIKRLLEVDSVTAASLFQEKHDSFSALFFLENAILSLEFLKHTRYLELFASNIDAIIAPFKQAIKLCIDAKLPDLAIGYYDRSLDILHAAFGTALRQSGEAKTTSLKKIIEDYIEICDVVIKSQLSSDRAKTRFAPNELQGRLKALKSTQNHTQLSAKVDRLNLALITKLTNSNDEALSTHSTLDEPRAIPQTQPGLSHYTLLTVKRKFIELHKKANTSDQALILKFNTYCDSILDLVKANCLHTQNLIIELLSFLKGQQEEFFKLYSSKHPKLNSLNNTFMVLIKFYLSLYEIYKVRADVKHCSTTYNNISQLLDTFYNTNYQTEAVWRSLAAPQKANLKEIFQLLMKDMTNFNRHSPERITSLTSFNKMLLSSMPKEENAPKLATEEKPVLPKTGEPAIQKTEKQPEASKPQQEKITKNAGETAAVVRPAKNLQQPKASTTPRQPKPPAASHLPAESSPKPVAEKKYFDVSDMFVQPPEKAKKKKKPDNHQTKTTEDHVTPPVTLSDEKNTPVIKNTEPSKDLPAAVLDIPISSESAAQSTSSNAVTSELKTTHIAEPSNEESLSAFSTTSAVSDVPRVVPAAITTIDEEVVFSLAEGQLSDLEELINCCLHETPQRLFMSYIVQHGLQHTPYPDYLKSAAADLFTGVITIVSTLRIASPFSPATVEATITRFIDHFSLHIGLADSTAPSLHQFKHSLRSQLTHQQVKSLCIRAASYLHHNEISNYDAIQRTAREFLNRYSFDFSTPDNRRLKSDNYNDLLTVIENEMRQGQRETPQVTANPMQFWQQPPVQPVFIFDPRPNYYAPQPSPAVYNPQFYHPQTPQLFVVQPSQYYVYPTPQDPSAASLMNHSDPKS